MQPLLSSYYNSDDALHATMTPREIVVELDKHIIGQDDAKRAVAIALRNRWRRLQLPPELAKEVSPKNILMIGPTGVGKTEIARRLAALTKAPFIKVEATKFTEVGYVGRDVESIIRDLMELAIKMINDEETKKVNSRAEEAAEEKILDCILTPSEGPEKEEDKVARQLFREKLRDGQLDEKEIEMEVKASVDVEIMAPPGMEDMISQMQSAFQNLAGERKKRRTLKVKDALKQAREEIADGLVNRDSVIKKAIVAVEEKAIIFIDEIDKITAERKYGGGAGVSREGVQRDLLPLVEGCTVSTKYGMVKTDHILFITSGSFHLSKPSDLIPELQGRLPIRVELKPLTKDDFSRILTEPHASLITQYKALLETEGFNLDFAPDGIQRIAEIAYQINERSENIGARRLYTILERTLETVSFEATDKNGESLVVTAEYVDQQISKLVKDEDLSDYIL